MTNLPVYILIRTSRRPKSFARMFESIKSQDYPQIITIVHSDDPRDEYVTGDVIIYGSKYPKTAGTAPYNLYCNSLLNAIPDEPGWFLFLDDDDELTAPDVISRFVAQSKADHLNVCRVKRTDGKIYPRAWGERQSLQTECFMLHTDCKFLSKWWSMKGGDHYYTKKLIQILPINWIDNLILAQAQNGKGNGQPEKNIDDNFTQSHVKIIANCPINKSSRKHYIPQGVEKIVPYAQAVEYEKKGLAQITHMYKNETTHNISRR